MTKTLAIETSCDDTSIGIINFDGNTFKVENLYAYSQIKDHQQYGGIVPEIASRLHSEQIIAVLNNIDQDKIKEIDFISITTTPGLPGSLVVGKTIANMLGKYLDKPVINVNHIYGHIFSLFLEREYKKIDFPISILTASGGHNDIYLIYNKGQTIDKKTNDHKTNINLYGTLGEYNLYKLGTTLDDAAGECFDKVARMLTGPYPGGPWISQQAEKFRQKDNKERNEIYNKLNITENKQGLLFSRIWLSANKLEFSFSGTKSQIHNFIDKLEKSKIKLTDDIIQCIAYEFQESVIEVLSKKLVKAGLHYNAKTIGITGGVSANNRLSEYIKELLENKNRIKNNNNDKIGEIKSFISPTKKIYSTDNAAMIGVVGIIKYKSK